MKTTDAPFHESGRPTERKVRIRPAGIQDLEELVELLRRLFSIEADFEVNASRQRRGLSMLLDGGGEHRILFAAEAGGRVVGMASAQTLISTAEGGFAALVEDVVVAESFRGRGIGRMLVAAIERWAADRGVTRLQLLADRANAPALRFYDKQGWKATQLICLRRRP
ncbi:MAG: GNAT family N-acetyltransferase [Desulfobacterales bacterium]|jgi:GNAT superfamily N-acetyltransferase|nr:GNAT family N-acetyltransferase [Desulfobacterales bacterium]